MFAMCAEKVLRLAEIDCSSPMSAKSDLKTGSRDPCVGRHVQPRLRHGREQPGRLQRDGLAARCSGPVMTRTRVGGVSRMSTGTGCPGSVEIRVRSIAVVQPTADSRISSG